MFPIPEDVSEIVDETKWGKGFDVTDTDNHNPYAMNGYIVYRGLRYKHEEYQDEALWEYFTRDFAGWTADMFELADRDVVSKLRDHLRSHGVFVTKARGVKISKALHIILQEEKS